MHLDLVCPRDTCYARLEQDGPANWESDSVTIPLICPRCHSLALLTLKAKLSIPPYRDQ